MGLCESREHKEMAARTREIDRQLHQDYQNQKQVAKLLLLGSGEAGKTTLLKQMKILHANGFTEQERLEFKEHVFANIFNGMDAILRARLAWVIPFDNPDLEYDADLILDVVKKGLQRRPPDAKLSGALRAVWADNALRERVLPRRNEFNLQESCIHFLDSLERVTALDYVPDTRDILLLRIQTTDIVQVHYQIKSVDFCVFDVGGCRSERRKWIHCFDHVHAIISLSSISEFDQFSEESPNMNRLLDSMRVFRTICNSRWFIRTGIILFLNKRDLFERKIRDQHKSIRQCFRKYDGAKSLEAQADFVQKKFVALNANPKKPVWVHWTCVTDTNQISLILDDTIDLIIQKVLTSYGLS